MITITDKEDMDTKITDYLKKHKKLKRKMDKDTMHGQCVLSMKYCKHCRSVMDRINHRK